MGRIFKDSNSGSVEAFPVLADDLVGRLGDRERHLDLRWLGDWSARASPLSAISVFLL